MLYVHFRPVGDRNYIHRHRVMGSLATFCRQIRARFEWNGLDVFALHNCEMNQMNPLKNWYRDSDDVEWERDRGAWFQTEMVVYNHFLPKWWTNARCVCSMCPMHSHICIQHAYMVRVCVVRGAVCRLENIFETKNSLRWFEHFKLWLVSFEFTILVGRPRPSHIDGSDYMFFSSASLSASRSLCRQYCWLLMLRWITHTHWLVILTKMLFISFIDMQNRHNNMTCRT